MLRSMAFMLRSIAAAIFLCCATSAAAQEGPPDLLLRGSLTGEAHETYTELPFRVPAGVHRLTVAFEHTGQAQRSVIDLGLRDPERLRGWSGGNKSRFTLAETWATPSYLPGPLPAGTWRLILGAPNIRKDARADYVARIWFDRSPAFSGFAEAPLRDEPGWYRGDLHLHSGHSDGLCAARSGEGRVACPVFRTTEAAAARGLDFVALTEHNAASHHQALAELQPWYDGMLLIPGREITTFYGHANVLGADAPLDFQVGSGRVRDINAVLDQAAAAGALVSINHPGMPSGEVCMGCGWTAAETDFGKVQAVEVVNGGALRTVGGAADGPLSGLPFWEARLDEGVRLIGIAGSDNHDAGAPAETRGSVGRPTTAIWAEALSQTAVLAGLRSGRVFVDVDGAADRILDYGLVDAAGRRTRMGGQAAAATGAKLEVTVAGVPAGSVELRGSAVGAARAVPLEDAKDITLGELRPGWLRLDVRDAGGRLVLIGNPIWITPPASSAP